MVCNKKYWKSIRLKAKLDELPQRNSVDASDSGPVRQYFASNRSGPHAFINFSEA
ncbi:hypothetical protein N9B22_01115 [bacterium]|nr:hypothetical protein [bacterium]